MNRHETVYFIFVISCLLFVQSENVSKSKEEEGKRLLISDPDLIHSQMETLRRDVQTLTSQLTNLQSSHQTLQSSYQTLQSSYQTQLSKLSSLEDQIKHSQQGRNYVKTYTCNNKHFRFCFCFGKVGTSLLWMGYYIFFLSKLSALIFFKRWAIRYWKMITDINCGYTFCLILVFLLQITREYTFETFRKVQIYIWIRRK